MGKALDLTNQKFGMLTALYPSGEKTKSGLLIWVCQCDCGNIVNIPGAQLKSGNNKSCGCNNAIKKYNLAQSEQNKISIGTRFGKLTVIQDLGYKPYGNTGRNRRWYLCQCDCGNLKEAMGNSLKTNHIISCGQCNLSSKGEEKIKQLLEEHNYCYQYDTIFPEFFNETGRRLRFDFIVYNESNEIICFIEFDGRQHFTGPDTIHWGHSMDTLESIQEKDSLKNNFCKSHNYKLYRIPYYYLSKLTINTLFSEQFLVR